MTSPLENLCGPGKPLAEEPRDEREFAELRRAALVRLRDAQNPANALESRFKKSQVDGVQPLFNAVDYAVLSALYDGFGRRLTSRSECLACTFSKCS